MKFSNKIIKTGLIGQLDKDNPFVIYCNEKDRKKGEFFFGCSKLCKHNNIKQYAKRKWKGLQNLSR